ncbi:MAG: cyclase family protein [Burkholderiales bacterium]|nr:cyclase family protein [Burkholderiales bacterium]
MSAAIVDPLSDLHLYELSHRWGYNTPTLPGLEDVRVYRSVSHAKNGVMTQVWKSTMHSSTHVNAPLYLIPMSTPVGGIAMDRFFGSGVVLDIPKQKWELVTEKDLEAAKPRVETEDIVMIVTGWHRKYSDSKQYFGYSPGLSKGGAQWLVDRGVKLVGMDNAHVDHPLATSMGPQRNGPQIKYLTPEYKKATGRDASADYPEWNPAHLTLLKAGIPTIVNLGGDVDELLGKRCTFQAFPWLWMEGEACIVRVTAMLDPSGKYRIEPGQG